MVRAAFSAFFSRALSPSRPGTVPPRICACSRRHLVSPRILRYRNHFPLERLQNAANALEAARRVADRAASVAVPGAVARAARAIARVTRKGEEIALRDDGADPRTAGAAGAPSVEEAQARPVQDT